jgi:hypothetical protein
MAWVLGSAWMVYGQQFFWTLVVIASGFSMTLWGVLKLFERLTGANQDRQSVETADSQCALGDLTFDMPAGHPAMDVPHLTHCDGVDLSCLDGFHL